SAQPRVLDTFLDRRDELTRNGSAEDVVNELELAAARQRLELHLAVAELSMAAGLLLVAAVSLGRSGDGFPVRNPRQLEVHFDAEAALQLCDGDLDVRLTLAGNEQFLGLRIARVVDRRVFFLQPVKRSADLLLVAPALRLDRVRDDRLRKLGAGERKRDRLVRQQIICLALLQLR